MIEEIVRIHDRFSVEIKLGFITRKKQDRSDFTVNTWFFIPNSIDINPATYTKSDFYRDLKSNVRLVTPVFLLRDVAGTVNTPFILLQNAFEKLASHPTRSSGEEFEYHIKMFLSILKSALRDDIGHIMQNNISDDRQYLVDSFVSNASSIAGKYRTLRRIINVPTIQKNQMNYYLFGDEFMSNLIEYHAFLLLSDIDSKGIPEAEKYRPVILGLVSREIAYKKEMGFQVVNKTGYDENRELVFRLGMLKKYAENELFVKTNKKRDGVLIEQVYLSIAAGISMVFATAIAFSFQTRFGNLTMPFFVALVISYMLKDRIKELARYYFAHKLGKRYFDHKTDIELSGNHIGWSREAMDFIPEDKVPVDVLKIRDRSPILEANNRANREKIILYRKYVRLNRKVLDKSSRYPIVGVNDILRFNVSNLTIKMDNPEVPLFAMDDNPSGYTIVRGEKIYYINMILQLRFHEQSELLRYRLAFNRNGLKSIEKF
jgi:hypothetical protein